MNVALCFSGLVRTLKICHPSLEKVILDPLRKKFNVDIFGSFPKDDDSLKLLSFREVEIVEDISVDKIASQHLGNVNPSIRLDPYLVNCYLPQWKSWQNVSKLRQRYEIANNKKYDWVFRVRTDQVFQKTIEDLSQLSSNNIFIPNHDNHNGVNDCFGFSSSKNMDIYMNLIDYIETYVNRGVKFHTETMLLYHLNDQKIKINRTSVQSLTNRPLTHTTHPGTQKINYP